MLAHLVSGRWGTSEEWHPAESPAKRSWFSRLLQALFGKGR